MAVLAIAAGGALVGSAIGGAFGAAAIGAQIGWAVGSFVGQMLFAPHTTIEGPRLRDLGVQISSDGAPLADIYGSVRVAGNVIWSTDIIETRHETDVGGKGLGGPSATQVTYTYSVSLAVGLCEGEITGIRRIWADSKLIYSVALGADPATFIANTSRGTIRFYLGTETQTADATIAAAEGAANTPAFRGVAYVVFENFQLADFANHIPNFEFEVVRNGTYSYPFFNPALSGIAFYRADVDTLRNRVIYTQQHPLEGEHIYVWGMTNDSPTEHGEMPSDFVEAVLKYDQYKDEYVVIAQPGGGDGTVHYVRFDAATGAEIDERTLTISNFGPFINSAGNTETGGLVNPTGWVHDPEQNCFYGWAAGFSSGDIFRIQLFTQSQALIVSVLVEAGTTGWKDHPSIIDSDDVVWAVGEDGVFRLTHPATFYESPATLNASSAFYWSSRNEIWAYTTAGAPNGWVIFNLDTLAYTYASASGYQDATDSYTRGVANSKGQAWFFKVSGSAVDLDAILVNSDLTVEETLEDFVGAPDGLARNYTAVPGVIIPLPQNGTAQAFYEDALAPGTWALSDVVEDICEQVDLTDTDVTDLAGEVVRGYVVSRPMTARQALEPLAMAYSFDGVESDGEAKFVMRGGASVATLETEEMAARSGSVDDEPAEVWTSTRALETELPVAMTVTFMNQGTDYDPATAPQRRLTGRAKQELFVELPLVFTSTEASQIVDRLMRQAWIERERFEFALGPEWLKLDPTDVLTLPDSSRIRLTRTSFEPTGVIRCEAAGDDDGALVSYATGNEDDERAEVLTISVGGPSTVVVLDIPLLLDQHDDEGIYLGASGISSDWDGATVYRSTDAGATWTGMAPTATSAKIGRILSGNMRGDATPGLWDHGSRITVRFVDEDVAPEAPASLVTFYNGANAAAVGEEDDWEIVQFYTVADNGDGTYTLSDFLRGRRGTEWAMRYRGAGTRFVILESPEIVRAPLPVALIGTEILYKAVTWGGSIASERSVTDTFSGVSMKPYSPVQITSAKQASSGDIEVSWTRRARKQAEWTNGIEVPLDETTEEYALEFWTEGYGTLLRTVEDLSDAEYTYTAAMQGIDFGSPGDVDYVAVRIYQISDRVGRGYPGEALVGDLPALVTFDPDNTGSGFTLSADRKKVTRNGATFSRAPTTRGYRYGKWYWEMTVAGSVTNDLFLGISLGVSETSYWRWRASGAAQTSGTTDTGEDVPAAHNSGTKVYMFAWDAETGEGWMGVDGVWSSGGDPAAGTLPNFTHTPSSVWRPYVRSDTGGSTYSVTASFQSGNVYAVPDTFTLIR